MELKRVVHKALNRPVLRTLLPVLATLIKSLKYRRICRVWQEGSMWIHVHPDGVLVEREIHLATISELAALTRDYWFHEYTPKPGDVVVDVGAGSGWETMLFSQLVGDRGRVIAIEAHPGTYACLAEMVRRNGLKNVTPICCAVGDREGVIHISDGTDHQGNSIVAGGAGVPVPMRTLEEISGAEGIGRISFLKMNIEGAERLALPGLGNMAAYTDHVGISCHDFRADWGEDNSFRTRAEIESWLTSAGFAISSRNDKRTWIRDCVYGIQESRSGSRKSPQRARAGSGK